MCRKRDPRVVLSLANDEERDLQLIMAGEGSGLMNIWGIAPETALSLRTPPWPYMRGSEWI